MLDVMRPSLPPPSTHPQTASKNEVIAGQYSQSRAGVDATREHVEAIREEVGFFFFACKFQ